MLPFLQVFVPSIGTKIDVHTSFGGMWYAIVFRENNSNKFPEIYPDNAKQLASLGEEIKVIHLGVQSKV